MLSYNESLKILKETDALLEGHFILSSGLHSNQYVQCAKLLSYPKIAEKICSSLCEKISNNFGKIDIILSPAIGGIIVGYEIVVILLFSPKDYFTIYSIVFKYVIKAFNSSSLKFSNA